MGASLYFAPTELYLFLHSYPGLTPGAMDMSRPTALLLRLRRSANMLVDRCR